MNRVTLTHIPLNEPSRFSGWPRIVHRGLFGLFVMATLAAGLRHWQPAARWAEQPWLDGLTLILATATTVASLACRLPGQNVIAVSSVIALIGAAASCSAALIAVPFGPLTFTDNLGRQLFYPLPWAIPMLWVVVVINSRDVARLALRPWRQNPAYGFWLIGVTALLMVILDFGLEPYAAQIRQYWTWKPTRIASDWYTAPWINFFGWGVTGLLILAFATPWLLPKKPVKPPAPDYGPLGIWLLVNLLFLSGAAAHRLWTAAGLVGGQCLVVTLFAFAGGRRSARTG